MDPANTPTPPPVAAGPSTRQLDSTDKLWIVLSHLSPFLGVGLILPLIIWLVKKDDSPIVAGNALEALNFHLSVFLYLLAAWLLAFVLIGFVLLPLVGVVSIILAIVGAVKSAGGEPYRYPFTLRLVK
jgi:uncharacterized Tic20 family protein